TKEPDFERAPGKVQRLLKSCLQRIPNTACAISPTTGACSKTRPLVQNRLARYGKSLRCIRHDECYRTLVAVAWRIASKRTCSRGSGTRSRSRRVSGIHHRAFRNSVARWHSTSLVFVSRGQDGISRLFARRLKQSKATLLSNTNR